MITAKGKIFLIHRTIKGLEIITYKEFLSTRQLLFYRSYLLKNEVNIEDLVRRHKYNRYKLIYNNCETFANKFVDEYSTKHRHHYSEQVLYWVYAVLLLVFLLTLALLTGIGVTTTISALTVILIFLTVISSNWDYVK